MAVEMEIVPWPPSFEDDSLTLKWRECLAVATNFRLNLQSPEWVAFRMPPAKRRLAVLRDFANACEPIGVTPVTRDKFALSFQFGKRTLGEIQLDGYLLNGNIPLFPSSDDYCRTLLNGIFVDQEIQCVYFLGLPRECRFYELIQRQKCNNHVILYDLSQLPARYFWIDMTESYEQYCAKFNSKVIYNLKRELRLLKGRVHVERVTEADQVCQFLENARDIAERSWQRLLVGEPLDKPVDSMLY
jgi:hypothetical protein